MLKGPRLAEDATLRPMEGVLSRLLLQGPQSHRSLLDPAPVSQQGLVPGPHHAVRQPNQLQRPSDPPA